MSNLDNLITKIIGDAQREAGALLQNAEEQKKKIMHQRKMEAMKEKEELLNNAKAEAAFIREQAVSNARIKARDERLKAKGEVIQTVLARALEELKRLDNRTYVQFLEHELKDIKFTGKEILVVPKDKRAIVEQLEIPCKLAEDETVDSGFKLICDRLVINNTFESIIHYYRDDLELAASHVLFD